MSRPSTSVPQLPVNLHWRLLDLQDLDVMEALHKLSIANLPSQMVKPETREFLQSLLQGRGRVVGAWHSPTELIAYGVLQHDLLPSDDPREHLQLPLQQAIAKLAGAAVAPAWQRRGLQRALISQRIAYADRDAILFATAAPENTASWHNLLACGFRVRALEYRYGGLARYLLVRLPNSFATSIPKATGLELGLNSLTQQQALFSQGWQGIAPGTTPRSLYLCPPDGGHT